MEGTVDNNFSTRDDKELDNIKQSVISMLLNSTQDKNDVSCSNLSVAELKRILRQKYRKLTIPIVPWLKFEAVLFCEDYFVQLELQDTKETISLENIFIDEKVNQQINWIYIEAPPGFGKTTLACKLEVDWINDEKYIQKFDLAFLVILRYLRGKSIKTTLSEIVDQKDDDKVWDLINNEKTLIIFDGLDEIDDKDKKKILKLQFEGTIVITGRTGSYRIQMDFSEMEKSNTFWDRFITIIGIDERNRSVFLNRLFGQSEMIKKIDALNYSLSGIFKSPTMLILLAYVLCENPGLNIDNITKTELFKNLTNCLVNQSQSKFITNFASGFNLFSDEHFTNDEIVELFVKFGFIALENLKYYNLQFEANEIVEKIYKMGFLIKHEIKEKFKTPKVHYKGLDLSIIEFAIAFSFWINYKKNGNFTNDQLICIKNFIVEKGKESLIVPFLCGLMGEEVNELFNKLKPHLNLLTCGDISFLLSECYRNDWFYEAITPLLEIKHNKPSNELVQLIKYGVQFKKLKHITIDIEFLAHLPVNLTGVNIHVIISSNIQQKAIVELKCKKVTFEISDNLSDLELKFVVNTFNRIDSESKQIEINNLDVVKLFLKNGCIITRLDELKFTIRGEIKTEDNITAEEFIAFVTENCRVKTIVFNINSDYFKLLQELLIFSNLFKCICCHDIDKIQFHIYCNTDKIIFLPKFDNTKLELEWEKYKPFERLFNIKRKMN